MSSSFSLGSTELKNRIASDATLLICLEVGVKQLHSESVIETLHLVSNNEDRTLGGVLYTAFPFRVDFNYELGAQADLSVTAVDVSRDLQRRMQEHNGGVGFDVTLKIFHQDAVSDPPDFEELFQIVRSNSNDYTVTWKLGSENLLDRNFPARRQYRNRCSFRYKGPECKYLGDKPTCDYTLTGANGCEAHSNSLNFGGFPGLRNG